MLTIIRKYSNEQKLPENNVQYLRPKVYIYQYFFFLFKSNYKLI